MLLTINDGRILYKKTVCLINGAHVFSNVFRIGEYFFPVQIVCCITISVEDINSC